MLTGEPLPTSTDPTNDSNVPNRLTGATFTLPDSARQALKAADTLYYRIGTTTSQTGWDTYVASTPDDQAANAKSISITGVRAAIASAA